jgi:TolB protein
MDPMTPNDGSSSLLRRLCNARSLARGFWAFALGCLGTLRAQGPQVVLEAGRTPELVLACAQPEFKGPVDPGLGKAFLDTVHWDLAHSGAVRALTDAELAGPGPFSSLAMRRAGANLQMTLKLARGWSGKLVVHVEVMDLGSEGRVFRKAFAGEDRAVPRMAHRMVDELIGALTGVPGVAGSRLLFAHERGPGRKEIYQVDPDGKNLLRITYHESLSISPSVTATGRLAYVTYVGGLPHIWGQLKRGEPNRCLYPGNPSAATMAFTPAWSPDGKRLALVQPNHEGESDIVLLNPGTMRGRQLTGNSGINTEPAWSPSGSQIAFTSDRSGTPQLYLMEKDGSNVRRLTLEGAYNASPAWSPDGSMLAYVSRMDGRFNLFLYKLAEGKAYQVTRGMASSESPAWSPDGRWIAFASDQDNKRQLYVVNPSGTMLRKVLDLPHCQSPQWTRSR